MVSSSISPGEKLILVTLWSDGSVMTRMPRFLSISAACRSSLRSPWPMKSLHACCPVGVNRTHNTAVNTINSDASRVKATTRRRRFLGQCGCSGGSNVWWSLFSVTV